MRYNDYAKSARMEEQKYYKYLLACHRKEAELVTLNQQIKMATEELNNLKNQIQAHEEML